MVIFVERFWSATIPHSDEEGRVEFILRITVDVTTFIMAHKARKPTRQSYAMQGFLQRAPKQLHRQPGAWEGPGNSFNLPSTKLLVSWQS